MGYRLKTCPVCGTEHRQRGPNCSKSCSNKARPYSEETRQKLSKAANDYYLTPEGLAKNRRTALMKEKMGRDNAKRAAGEYVLEPEDYALDVPFNLNDEEVDDVRINW